MINIDESRLTTIAQIEELLSASASSEYTPDAGGDCERYAHISAVLRRFDYPRRNRRERDVLLAYLRHTSGYSRAQMTRLVERWQENRLASAPLVKHLCAPAAPFPRKYTPGDVALLVEIDRANEDVCGPVIVRQVKYLNNIVEQDHRAIKRVTKPMLNFKSFRSARNVLAGIELMHMIRKGQLMLQSCSELSFADKFYALAGQIRLV